MRTVHKITGSKKLDSGKYQTLIACGGHVGVVEGVTSNWPAVTCSKCLSNNPRIAASSAVPVETDESQLNS